MRSDYKSYDIFSSTIGILTAIYKLVVSMKVVNSISINLNEDTYVCGPDWEYVYGAFSQLLCRRGAKFIELESMTLSFKKGRISITHDHLSRLIVANMTKIPLSHI